VFVAFYDFVFFVSVVSRQFTSSVWDAHDGDDQFPLLVNTSSRSQWKAAWRWTTAGHVAVIIVKIIIINSLMVSVSLQWTTKRKPHVQSPTITLPMTSRDPKSSNS